MSKTHVALLGLLAALLVADGPAPPAAQAKAPPDPAVVVSAQDVAGLLAEVNPHLSARELERMGNAVVRYSVKYALDPELVIAVIRVESNARPWATSPKGAMGLMQVMPYVARPMGMAGNFATIESNVEAGCFILASNIDRLGEEDGISAYFWGSDIRGAAYLDRVRAARAEVRRQLSS
ncbi:MAG TPA: transglycosylase SLT domain-containing protein [Myxococcota bacterium]|nr:transglycosylase SLT domain-containing protein [Myxococcota bacterium]